MKINYTPATNRVNPAELRALRQAVTPTRRICQCVRASIAGAVSAAAVALGQDWSQEADYLVRELEATEPAALTISR